MTLLSRLPLKFRIALLLILGFAVAATPWWGPSLLSRMSFFRLQNVEVRGLVHLAESELLETLAVDTTMSLWMDLRGPQERLAAHPQLLSVSLSRKLPGTLVVRVSEKRPVALVPGGTGLLAIDSSGEVLPVDPARDNVDAPVLRVRSDTVLLRLLTSVRDSAPDLYRRISEVARVGDDELAFHLLTVKVLTMANVTVDRLLDILPVERDLAARGQAVAELDLRFNAQVIARLK